MQRVDGFSLIEVVLALGVVAFSLVAILGVFPAALSQNRKGISDTRAAQLIRMIVATIDSQASNFSAIDCFGATLDLSNSSTTTAPVILYAEYPSLYGQSPPTDQPTISPGQSPRSIYSIEIRFNNAPELAPAVTLPAGSVNQLQFRVRGISTTSSDFLEFMYLARKKT